MAVGSKRFGGVLYIAYPADHFPRHLHAFVGDGEVIIMLGGEKVTLANRDDAIRGGATVSDARKALRLAEAHFVELLDLWRACMTKQLSRVTTTDEEIEAAVAKGKIYDQHFTPAVAAEYRAMDDVVAIRLSNGVDIIIPRPLLQGLEQANPSSLNDINIVGSGSDSAGNNLMSITTFRA